MKKFVATMIILVTVFAVVTANAEIMNGHINSLVRIAYDNFFEKMEALENNEKIVEDGVLYWWCTNSCFDDQFIGLSNTEIEEKMTERYYEITGEKLEISIKYVGINALWMNAKSKTDLIKVENFLPEGVEGPVYEINVIAWKDYLHMW